MAKHLKHVADINYMLKLKLDTTENSLSREN
jgi:hypothetical protein